MMDEQARQYTLTARAKGCCEATITYKYCLRSAINPVVSGMAGSLSYDTHNLGTVEKMCDRVAVMYLGRIVESAPAVEIYKNPRHPYTQGLIGSVHKLGTKKQERLFAIGLVADGEWASFQNVYKKDGLDC